MIFRKKKVEAEINNVEDAVKVVHANPHGDPVCDGCGKPMNTVQVRVDGKQFHNQYCYNEAK